MRRTWKQEVSNKTDLHSDVMSKYGGLCTMNEKLKVVVQSSLSKSTGVNAVGRFRS